MKRILFTISAAALITAAWFFFSKSYHEKWRDSLSQQGAWIGPSTIRYSNEGKSERMRNAAIALAIGLSTLIAASAYQEKAK